MKLTCMFRACDWQFITNVVDRIEEDGGRKCLNFSYWKTGLYQCRRCKTLSIGAPGR